MPKPAAILQSVADLAQSYVSSRRKKSVIARVALQPRRTFCQKRSRPTPYGDTTPMPVIATSTARRAGMYL